MSSSNSEDGAEGIIHNLDRKRITRRKALSTVAKVGIGAGIVAVAGGTGAYYLFSPKARERPLVIVQWGGSYVDATRPIVEAFTKETGIPADFILHASGSAAQVGIINSELPRVTRDVIAAWNPVWGQMDEEDWLEPLTPEKIPAMNDLEEFAKFKGPRSSNVVALGWGPAETAWVYREDLVPKDLQPITSFDQLFDPRFERKFLSVDMVWGVGAQVLTMAAGLGGNERNLEPGWTLLKDLAKKHVIGTVQPGEAEQTALLSSGEMWIGMLSLATALSMKNKGVPLRRIFSDKMRSYVNLEGFIVLKQSPYLEDALKFMNFMYRKDNLEEFAKNAGFALSSAKGSKITNPVAAEFYSKPEDYNKYVYFPDFPYMSANVDALQQRFEEEVLPLIG